MRGKEENRLTAIVSWLTNRRQKSSIGNPYLHVSIDKNMGIKGVSLRKMTRKLQRVGFWIVMATWVLALLGYWSNVFVGDLSGGTSEIAVAKRSIPVTAAPVEPVGCNCPKLEEPKQEPAPVIVQEPVKLEPEPEKVKGPPKTNYPIFELKTYIPNYYTKLSDSEKPLADETTLAFMHSKKGSGVMKSCILDVWKAAYASEPTPEIVYDDNVVGFHISHNKEAKPLNKFYVGEATFGICELSHNQKPCAYFTMLREPYERIVSLYEHCQDVNHKNDRECSLWDFKSISIVDFAKGFGNHVFAHMLYNPAICSNKYKARVNEAIKVTGPKDKIDMSKRAHCWYGHKAYIDYFLSKEDKHELLDYVLDNLENWFTTIGISDEYNFSLQLMTEAFGAPFKKFRLRKNTFEEARSPAQKKRRLDLKYQLMSDPSVYESLYYDLRIYDEVLKIFHQQKRQYFSLMADKTDRRR